MGEEVTNEYSTDNNIRSVDSVTNLNIEYEISRLLGYYKNSVTKYIKLHK